MRGASPAHSFQKRQILTYPDWDVYISGMSTSHNQRSMGRSLELDPQSHVHIRGDRLVLKAEPREGFGRRHHIDASKEVPSRRLLDLVSHVPGDGLRTKLQGLISRKSRTLLSIASPHDVSHTTRKSDKHRIVGITHQILRF